MRNFINKLIILFNRFYILFIPTLSSSLIKKINLNNFSNSIDKKKNKVLILAPHFDDEILGCYNLIYNNKKNKISIAFITDSKGTDNKINYDFDTRKKESLKALSKFENIQNVYYFKLPDQGVKNNLDLLEDKIKIISKSYNFVFSPTFWDKTIDHKWTAIVSKSIVPINKLIYYRSTYLTFNACESSFFEVCLLKNKIESLKNFKSQEHLLLKKQPFFSSYKSKSGKIYSVECFLKATDISNIKKINFNTLSIFNSKLSESFTCK